MKRCGQSINKIKGVYIHLPANLTTCPQVTVGRTEAANRRFSITRTVLSGKLVLAFASTVILGFGSRGTHDHIFHDFQPIILSVGLFHTTRTE
jgi:hypothetical protein